MRQVGLSGEAATDGRVGMQREREREILLTARSSRDADAPCSDGGAGGSDNSSSQRRRQRRAAGARSAEPRGRGGGEGCCWLVGWLGGTRAGRAAGCELGETTARPAACGLTLPPMPQPPSPHSAAVGSQPAAQPTRASQPLLPSRLVVVLMTHQASVDRVHHPPRSSMADGTAEHTLPAPPELAVGAGEAARGQRLRLVVAFQLAHAAAVVVSRAAGSGGWQPPATEQRALAAALRAAVDELRQTLVGGSAFTAPGGCLLPVGPAGRSIHAGACGPATHTHTHTLLPRDASASEAAQAGWRRKRWSSFDNASPCAYATPPPAQRQLGGARSGGRGAPPGAAPPSCVWTASVGGPLRLPRGSDLAVYYRPHPPHHRLPPGIRPPHADLSHPPPRSSHHSHSLTNSPLSSPQPRTSRR